MGEQNDRIFHYRNYKLKVAWDIFLSNFVERVILQAGSLGLMLYLVFEHIQRNGGLC